MPDFGRPIAVSGNQPRQYRLSFNAIRVGGPKTPVMKSESRPRPASAGLSPSPELGGSRFLIEDVYPSVDGGRFPVKRIAGEPIDVWADIFRDGHEVSAASLLWCREGKQDWRREPMRHSDNDRWTGSFTPSDPGRYLFAIEAWTDTYATWRRDLLLKRQAGQAIDVEIEEGRVLLAKARHGSAAARAVIKVARESDDVEALLSDDVAAAMAKSQPRPDLSWSRTFPLIVDRERAGAGAWYELFPRSQSPVPGRHGTFDDCIARLPDIAGLGFDVLYLPPIHPIGRVNRKGRNNALSAEPGDPGSPYAIGAAEGGHDAIHPELGTLEDFRRLVAACRNHGMEVALDFATQCAPDHPWLQAHPDWFKRRPDGSIKYAENPPKKYQDIHNPDFHCADRAALWTAFRDIVQFWVDQGVRIFRVDNPHTKPFAFWQWLIQDIQSRDAGVIFLSEAFTRPKVMKALAKLGFTQSYTYFTWRTTKAELSAYLAELTRHPEREYFRPNLFVNTPDILPIHLQTGEAWMFKSRVALAATLSSNYGVYSGFELLEHAPLPGREEYLDAEKYEIKVRDWDKPGNIKSYIAELNRLRRANPALLQTSDLRFAQVDDDQVIGFVKESVARDNAVAVAIAVTGYGPREFWFHFGDLEIGPPTARRHVAAVEDLRTGERQAIAWGGVRLRIDPATDPAVLLRCVA
jgi:starch synthase (maltosyl-transferring)